MDWVAVCALVGVVVLMIAHAFVLPEHHCIWPIRRRHVHDDSGCGNFS